MVFFRRFFSVAKSYSLLQALVAQPNFTKALTGANSYPLLLRGTGGEYEALIAHGKYSVVPKEGFHFDQGETNSFSERIKK